MAEETGCGGRWGQLQFNSSNVPQVVAGGFTFTDLVAGYNYTCAIRSTTVTMCWGQNFRGELGDGTFDDRGLPTTVSGGHSFVDLGAGDEHTCGVTTGDSLYCWGGQQRWRARPRIHEPPHNAGTGDGGPNVHGTASGIEVSIKRKWPVSASNWLGLVRGHIIPGYIPTRTRRVR